MNSPLTGQPLPPLTPLQEAVKHTLEHWTGRHCGAQWYSDLLVAFNKSLLKEPAEERRRGISLGGTPGW